MTHVSLFTGIGGIDLAAEWAGFETILQVERDPYCQRVLEKHWPEVPRHDDIHSTDGRSITADLVSGGWPCQPFSTASRGRAVAESLWPAMLRLLGEIMPRWVLGENVQRKPMASAAADLARLGYRSALLAIPAATVGAPHYRARWFLVADHHSNAESAKPFYAAMASLSSCARLDTWQEPPDDLAVDDGLPAEVAQRLIGNSIMPQQVYPILAAIAGMES